MHLCGWSNKNFSKVQASVHKRRRNMKSIALRFSDNFAPPEGTIEAHRRLIVRNGFVWYGKLGSAISDKVAKEVLAEPAPRILLIHSGKSARYWAFISGIQREQPDDNIPTYYRNRAVDFKTWFHICNIEEAPKDVLSHCIVPSSGNTLSYVSKGSMSPYFIIEYNEEDERINKADNGEKTRL